MYIFLYPTQYSPAYTEPKPSSSQYTEKDVDRVDIGCIQLLRIQTPIVVRLSCLQKKFQDISSTFQDPQNVFPELCRNNNNNTFNFVFNPREFYTRGYKKIKIKKNKKKLEIRSVERGICPIATSIMNELFL